MNLAASKLFAEGFFQGYFDVVGAMLSSAPACETGDPSELAPEVLTEHLNEFGVVMKAVVAEGGAILVLMRLEDARAMTSGVMGDEPPADAEITDDEAATMKEIFDPCMGGGVSHFKEKYEKVIELQPTEIAPASPDAAGALQEALGGPATVVSASFAVPDTVDSGAAVLIFSQSLESAIPPEALGDETADEDVQEILEQSFGEQQQEAPAEQVQAAEAPGNIGMILDIGLEVTARLGRIEMPLGQVLELGPGSIIEVGHSVDEPVELLVNDKLIARGDVVVVEEKFGLRITEIVSPAQRIESLR